MRERNSSVARKDDGSSSGGKEDSPAKPHVLSKQLTMLRQQLPRCKTFVFAKFRSLFRCNRRGPFLFVGRCDASADAAVRVRANETPIKPGRLFNYWWPLKIHEEHCRRFIQRILNVGSRVSAYRLFMQHGRSGVWACRQALLPAIEDAVVLVVAVIRV